MRGLWLTVAFVLFAAAARAEEPTPPDAPLPAGEVSLIACPYPGPGAQRGGGAIFHYRLYLPADYHDGVGRKYPVMFIAAPLGNATMGPLAPRLSRERWIVAMMIESRNRSNAWLPNFIAAYDDLVARVRVQRGMLFCTGVSGAARVCSVYPGLRPGFRGVILQAAGYWKRSMFDQYDNRRLVIYGTFGSRDPNLRYVGQIRRAVPDGVRSLVEVWDGGHGWAPAPVLNRALDWVMTKALVETGYDETLADAYRWYLANQLASYDRASSDIERYVVNERVQGLPARWHLALDDATRAKLDEMKAAMRAGAGDAALARERAARDAFAAALAREEAARGRDLVELIEAYGRIARDFTGTVYGAKAAIRARSLAWETGRARPPPAPEPKGWHR